MISFLPVFQEYAKELIGYAIGEAVEQEEFLSLKKGKKFQIRVGECLEPGEMIFPEVHFRFTILGIVIFGMPIWKGQISGWDK